MSTIFISHSSKDNEVASEMKVRLSAQGHTSVFLDFDPENGIPAGRNWEKELYANLRACQAMIFLWSKHSAQSNWCFAEITHARALGRHVIPITIGPLHAHPLLSDTQMINMTQDKEDAYIRLWKGLQDAGLDPLDQFDWDSSRPPYPGLMSFQERDAAVYFGREELIRHGLEVLNRLRLFGGHRLVLILGASGCGKSSLLRAGLLPRLRRSDESWLALDPFRPLGKPFLQLGKSIAKCFARYGEKRDWKTLGRQLREAALGDGTGVDALVMLAEDLRMVADKEEATVVLAIDQMEELLGADSGPETDQFLSFIRRTLETPRSPFMAIGTLRSDFLKMYQEQPEVRDMSVEAVYMGPMAADELARVISNPAQIGGIELEAGLVNTMIADTETEDALPLLAFTLRELWDGCRRDRKFTVEDYREKLGGLEGSVALAAEAVFKGHCDSACEDDVRTAFLRMVRVNEEGQYVRRTTRWRDLPAEYHGWLEKFVKARLLVSSSDGQHRILEVAHEALFRSWDRLSRWLAANHEFLLWRKRLSTALQEWERIGRGPDALLRGAQLAEAERWLVDYSDHMGAAEREFLEASQYQRKEEEARRETELQRARAIRRLSDIKRLQELQSRAEVLWPAFPARTSEYEDWLEDADALIGRLDDHKRTLLELRDRALPDSAADTRWKFEDEDDAWWHDTLTDLVGQLESLMSPDKGLISGVDPELGWGIERRLEFAKTIEEESITGTKATRCWGEMTTSAKRIPVYAGFRLKPQLGLIPIGRDPESGLWEFAHLQTGVIPVREKSGRLTLTEDCGLVFVLIPGGNFYMGAQKDSPDGHNYDPNAQPDESPVKRIQLPPFFMSKYQFTQAQWLRFTGMNPSRYGPGKHFGDETYSLLNPVEQVTWHDCTRLLSRLGLKLPTEAQWEYAARAGTETPWWPGENKESLHDAANISDAHYTKEGGPIDWSYENWDDGRALHAPVGSYRPNPFGLHDVHGNVWEWCLDNYGDYNQPIRETDCLRDSTNTTARVYRGGCYYRTSVSARSALRRSNTPEHQIDYLGFRPAKDVFY